MTERRFSLILAAVLAFAAALCLCGCGKDAPVSDTPDTDPAVVSGSSLSGSDVSDSDGDAVDVSPSDWIDYFEGEDARAIAEMLADNCAALNAEDVDGYMAAIDPDSPSYKSTRKDAEELFENYNLTATIENASIVMPFEGSDEAEATVTETMCRREGDEEGKSFTAVETVLRHSLVRKDGRWFIASTVVSSRRELTDKWSLFEQFAADPSIYVVPSASDAAAPVEG